MSKPSSAEKITQYILDNFKDNKLPWRPDYETNAPSIVTPVRHSGEYYRGVNMLILLCSALQQNFTSPHWITFKQCQAEGGNLKGQKGTRIMKFGHREIEGKNPDDDNKSFPYIKIFSVFNISQCTNLPSDYVEQRTVAETCTHSLHDLVDACGVTLHHGHTMGAYYPGVDQIRMPNKSAYTNDDCYAATLAHELIHATGHSGRLNRLRNRDDIVDTAKEELTAEIGGAMLLARLQIPSALDERVIPYIAGWIENMASDPKYILQAAAAAQKAIDHIFECVQQTANNEVVEVA